MKKQKIQNIINHYKKWRKENPDTWIDHCIRQETIEDAIVFAALAENHQGKRNRHQRQNKTTLEKFAAKLLDSKEEIESSSSFDDLIRVVEQCKISEIGNLTCYDTAERIGAKSGITPDKIYLHAGTKNIRWPG